MNQPLHRSSSTNPRRQLPELEDLPQKQQWAIINKYKALEYEKMKERQFLIDKQKKQQFRHALDQQLNSKHNTSASEKQQDKLYYQKLSQKGQQQRLRQQAQRYEKYAQRRRVDSQNFNKLHQSRSRVKNYDTGYHLQIGVQSQKQHKTKSDHFKKEMIDTLDIQLRQKNQEQRMNKLINDKLQQQHKRAEMNYYKPMQRKNYGQNQKIYDYYRELDYQKQAKDKQIEHRLVDEAKYRQQILQKQRQQQKQAMKHFKQESVIQTLGQQLKQIHRKKFQEGQSNPQQHSFSFISSVFEPKYKGYNKQQYKRQLQRQVQEQRLKKIKQAHMSDQQYRLNLNQLSKAVIGDYAQRSYLDRSLGAIGQHEKYGLEHLNVRQEEDRDVGIIKSRLKNLRERGNLSTIA